MGTTEGYPNITRTVQPEGYEGLVFTLTVNLTGAEFVALASTEPATLGPALVKAFNGKKYEWGGLVFDFSTPEAALAMLERDDVPMDLKFWFRNAPIEATDVYLEHIRGNFRKSFEATKS
jgi:hypothetical protein